MSDGDQTTAVGDRSSIAHRTPIPLWCCRPPDLRQVRGVRLLAYEAPDVHRPAEQARNRRSSIVSGGPKSAISTRTIPLWRWHYRRVESSKGEDQGHSLRRLTDATGEPASVPTLARRRRITHLIAAVLLVVAVVALIISPNDPNETNAATLIGGAGFILLFACVVVSVQYTVRIHWLRSGHHQEANHPAEAPEAQAPFPVSSLAYRAVVQLRSADRLLESVLPDISDLDPGLGSTADKARLSLEHTASQVRLQEAVLASLAADGSGAEAKTNDMKRTVRELADRLQSGVDQYTALAEQASSAAISLRDVDNGDALQEASDQLAGLNQGLREVQRISEAAS
jgi:hypothetical protein